MPHSFFVLLCQVSSTAGKWTDRRENSCTIFQGKVQLAAQVPPSALPASGAGAETHVPAFGGESQEI